MIDLHARVSKHNGRFPDLPKGLTSAYRFSKLTP